MHEIDYTVKLSGSKLFDFCVYNMAQKVCNNFPGLKFECTAGEIRIYGELNDFWYEKYTRAMFEIGSFEE